KKHNLTRSQRCGASRLDHRRRAASAGFSLRVSAGAQSGPEHQTVSGRTSRKFHREGQAMKRPRPATATSDKEVLHRFGYAQLLRDMGGFSSFAISFSIISILTGAVTLYAVGLNAGGPVVMGIGWPLVTLFVLFVAAGLAELASAIPTSGALYHWASFLGGPTLGWMTACLNVIGWIAAMAGIDYGCAQFMVPLLGLPETSTNFML